jgi:hypothetical protein
VYAHRHLSVPENNFFIRVAPAKLAKVVPFQAGANSEVYRAVIKLDYQGVYPTARLVLAAIPHPSFRSLDIVAEAARRARRDLLIAPYDTYIRQLGSGRTDAAADHWDSNLNLLSL